MRPHAQPAPQAFDAGFMRLMAEWEKPMFDFAWQYLRDSQLAGDLVAVAFVRFYHACPRLGKTASPAPGLFSILSGLCQRQMGRAVPAIETDPELRALTAAIDSLSHAYKTPWLLRQCTLLSNQEIAEALTLRDEQVSQRLHRARQLIVAQLQQPSQPAAVSMEPVSIPA
jgi:DNA-directed RNA polymerase specialized sigma24 family protein